MAVALVANTSLGNNGTTSSIDTTGANLLVVYVAHGADGTGTLSDSKGNTWTQIGSTVSGVSLRGSMYYAKDATAGSGHTFTLSGAHVPSFCVAAFSGVTADPLGSDTGAGVPRAGLGGRR